MRQLQNHLSFPNVSIGNMVFQAVRTRFPLRIVAGMTRMGSFAITSNTLAIGEALKMNTEMQELPVEERIRIVEDLWDSIAAEQKSLGVTSRQREELDRRIDAYEADGNRGRLGTEVVADIRRKL